MARERLKDIDKAKGFAIFLVVLGHITLSSAPKDAEWYEWIRLGIYKFHMPFFMYLSGYTMYYVLPIMKSFNEYKNYIYRKTIRLLPPLLIFGLLIGIGKFIMQIFIPVDSVPPFSYYEFAKILIEPTNSFARSIWYIYILLLYYLTIPLLLILTKLRLFPLLILGIVLHFYMPTSFFGINSFNEYLLYFVIGMISVKYRSSILEWFNSFKILFMVVFLLSFSILFFSLNSNQSKLIISLCSIPALHSLFLTGLFDKSKQILLFAKYTFVIYLLNTITIGLTKGVILKFFSWDGYRFFIFAPILVLVGLYGPIVIKKFILSRNNYLDKITT
jgi:fucose 4-O-acetylase-like acetyltransferase